MQLGNPGRRDGVRHVFPDGRDGLLHPAILLEIRENFLERDESQDAVPSIPDGIFLEIASGCRVQHGQDMSLFLILMLTEHLVDDGRNSILQKLPHENASTVGAGITYTEKKSNCQYLRSILTKSKIFGIVKTALFTPDIWCQKAKKTPVTERRRETCFQSKKISSASGGKS